jgi:hypothetical protein
MVLEMSECTGLGLGCLYLMLFHSGHSLSHAIIRSFSTNRCFICLNSSSEAFRFKFEIQVIYPVAISELDTWGAGCSMTDS